MREIDLNLEFNLDSEKDPNAIIKVVGVGGGGGNAVNHMYRQGIHNVNFVVCNTDRKALEDSPVQHRLQLGEGLGAGNKPEVACEAAEAALEAIRDLFRDGTKMAFITAGMGGGTGTGAAPIVAREAKSMDVLTVGIVTIPFKFEGNRKIDQALDGVERIAEHVDALLVINNERLREIYADLSLDDAFEKADDMLTIAARSIAEIIAVHGKVGVDFNDVRTVLKDGGIAIMSMGMGEGDNRVEEALKEALHSPLLNNNDIFNSKKILLSVSYNPDKETGRPLMMHESDQIDAFMSRFNEKDYEFKWGMSHDESLGKKVKVMLLATGFGVEAVSPLFKRAPAKTLTPDLQIEEEKKREADELRRRSYYENTNGTNRVRRRYNNFIFSEADIDNADVILAVESSPTYRRSTDTLSNIRSRSTATSIPSTTAEEAPAPTINF
ncbi:MAG: cell division protein FtsZ [Bacteroidales bacterium]|nr:cell division protein FtsZ [Bacteroidales bacterium]